MIANDSSIKPLFSGLLGGPRIYENIEEIMKIKELNGILGVTIIHAIIQAKFASKFIVQLERNSRLKFLLLALNGVVTTPQKIILFSCGGLWNKGILGI